MLILFSARAMVALILIICCSFQLQKQKSITVLLTPGAHARLQFGAEKLASSLKEIGYEVKMQTGVTVPAGKAVVITQRNDKLIKFSNNSLANLPIKKEAFSIFDSEGKIFIAGSDESGSLYGCLEFAERIRDEQAIPEKISLVDSPAMVLRGTCIGLQKPNYLPGRSVYEYPYTPETFPWFYDKKLWLRYLDSMVVNRYNSLYLWNGHPFASLIRLNDYPYAVEVDDTTFKQNEEMFKFLTTEADKRGIWVIQMFYNVLISRPFADKHGLKTQDRARPIIPIIADYTRKSIAAFVAKYPNVGLLVTLGEALEGEEQEVEWFTKTIIAGVTEGLKALGKTDQPPIVLRGHDTNPQRVMKAALPLYGNLYTMNKYNGEALTTYQPRGPWAQMHRELSELGSVHIDNVHILANLEPFRYGSADFIQKSVQAMHKIHGANGLHLYPESSYWDWPYSADKAETRLLQLDRDWLWYKAWARYAWNSSRARSGEIRYWSALISRQFGTDQRSSEAILQALEESGEIAPKLLRRFGITNGNRQTLTLGMTMSQLINPHRYRVWPELYSSDGPEGEMLIDFAEKEWNNKVHVGETPIQIIAEVVQHAKKAVDAINTASGSVKKDTVEFARLQNDVNAYAALANNFSEKVKSAALVLRYKYSNNINDLKKSIVHLENSLSHYRQLVDLTRNTYLYANSMQTGQRKIPVSGDGGMNKTWSELLPYYERELTNFKIHLDSLSSPAVKQISQVSVNLRPAAVHINSKHTSIYRVARGQSIFKDSSTLILEVAPALRDLQAIQFSKKDQLEKGTTFSFRSSAPVKLLVGYFVSNESHFLQSPNLEVDASANEYGQAEVKILNAIAVDGMPPVNVHAFSFRQGTHTLTLGKGTVLVLGFVADEEPLDPHDAGIGITHEKQLDWLFE